MRKLLVKHLTNYNFLKFKGREFRGSLRVVNTISTVIVIGGLIFVFTYNNNMETIGLIFLGVTGVLTALIYGFVEFYFKSNPVQWNEMTEGQKLIYAESMFSKLNAEELLEYSQIRNKFLKIENYNILPTILPTLNILIAILVPLIYLYFFK